MYADDTQLYSQFDNTECDTILNQTENCIKCARNWISENYLKLNESQEEFLVAKKKGRPDDCNHIMIGEEKLTAYDCVKDLGCIFDSTLAMEKHTQNLAKRCYHTLYQIS